MGEWEERIKALEQWMTQFTLDNHGRVLPSAEQMAGLEKRVAALEGFRETVRINVNGKVLVADYQEMQAIKDRLAALEELLTPVEGETGCEDGILAPDLPCYFCKAEGKRLGITTQGLFCCKDCSEGRQVVFSGQVSVSEEELLKLTSETLQVHWAAQNPLFGAVLFEEPEIEGMDLSDFKQRLRLKIDVMAEDVLRQFKERRGEGEKKQA